MLGRLPCEGQADRALATRRGKRPGGRLAALRPTAWLAALAPRWRHLGAEADHERILLLTLRVDEEEAGAVAAHTAHVARPLATEGG